MKKMKKTLLIIACLCLGITNIKAQEQTYNYQRANELYNQGQYKSAAEYLDKEIQVNPKNEGYCNLMLSGCYYQNELWSDALKCANNALKTLPKKDKNSFAVAYGTRGYCYLNLEDTISAISDFNQAIKKDDKYIYAYHQLGNIYRNKGEYKKSEENFKKIISIDKTISTGYYGLGVLYHIQKKYKQAVEQFNYTIKLNDENSNPYAIRAESYLELKDYNNATDDIITALAIDGNKYAYNLMVTLKDEQAQEIMKTKLLIKSKKESNDDYWLFLLGSFYESQKKYKKAIEFYEKGVQKNNIDSYYNRLAECFTELGIYNKALNNIEEAIKLDTSDYSYILKKANILNEMSKSKEAIRTIEKYIDAYPEYFFGYYIRGWYKEEIKDYEGAIEDYSIAITLEPKYAHSYLCRGKMYLNLGKETLAESDFKKMIEIDTANKRSYYAYYFLGNENKAMSIMDSILKNSESDDKSVFYEATCLYSLMNKQKLALEYLDKTLKYGYRNFAHIDRDTDLDNIRNTTEFKELIKKYKAMIEEEISEEENEIIGEYEEKIYDVPFTREGKICKVKCKINNLPLNMIFDTGASDVSISMIEASFMYKNGYINDKDIIGSQYFIDANGNINEGTIINLRNISLEDITLNNIRASVVRNQKAPLLLGQSVLERFGKIEIDNENKVLKITRKEKVKNEFPIDAFENNFFPTVYVKEEVEDDKGERTIFTVVEEQSSFPGGMEALSKYLSETLVYPPKAKEKGIQGKVFITFVIEKDGSISNARIIRDIGGGCGEEALRVVKSMPKWKPAKQRGKTVRQQFNLPVNFSLN